MKITERRLRSIIREELKLAAQPQRLDEGIWDDIVAQFDKAVQTGKMTVDQARRDMGSLKKMGSKGAEAVTAAQAGGSVKEVLEPFLPEIKQKIIDYIAFDASKMAADEANPSDFVPAVVKTLSSDVSEWVDVFEGNLKQEIQSIVSKMAPDIAEAVVKNLAPR